MSLTPPFPVQSTEQVQPEVFYRLLDDLFSEGVARSTDLQVVQHGAGTILSVDVDPGDGYVQFDSPYGGTRRVRLTAQSGGPQPLVLSGNEVTDAIRTRGPVIEGDGLSADSSTGIWKGTTNLITNGGLESNTTGWVAGATWTIARSTEQAKFGLSSLKCTFSTAGGDITEFPITLTAAKHAASLWLYIPTSWDGGQIALKVVGFTGATGTLEVNANMSLRDQWQRVPLSSFTPDAGDLTGTLLVVYSTTDPTAGRFIYVDGAQIEAREVATPYVETDGGTASRGNARVQGPRDALDVTQGWIALRMRRGFPNTNVPGSGNVFDVIWSDNVGAVNDQISIYIAGSGDIAARLGDTSGVQSVVISDTFAIGDITTLIITWTATTLALSVNGSVFSTSSRTKFPDPSLLASTFNIGSSHNDLWTYSDVFWAACGKGTLSNADAATIHGFGNVDPLASDFPGAAALSLLWPAVTSALASDEWARGFQTPDATDPRIDRVVALVEDSDLDSSGHRRWALDVAPGSAVAGATL